MKTYKMHLFSILLIKCFCPIQSHSPQLWNSTIYLRPLTKGIKNNKDKESGDNDIWRTVKELEVSQAQGLLCLLFLSWFCHGLSVWCCSLGITVVSAYSPLSDCNEDNNTFDRPVFQYCLRRYFWKSSLLLFPLAFLILSVSKSLFQKRNLLKISKVDSVRCN